MAPKNEHKVEIQIKSQVYAPRGKALEYRPGSVWVVDASEGYELEKAGIAIISKDPFQEPVIDELAVLKREAVEPFSTEKPQATAQKKEVKPVVEEIGPSPDYDESEDDEE